MTTKRLAQVDVSCKCDKCESRTQEFYVLKATCSNCDSTLLVKIRQGDKKPSLVECSLCGVNQWPFWGGMWDGSL